MHRSFVLSASIAAAIASIGSAFAETFHDAADRFAEACREFSAFLYSPSAAESIELDTIATEVGHVPAPWRAFRAFVSRALTHERYAGGGFTMPAGSTT